MNFSMMTYTMMRQKGYTPEDCVRVAEELQMEGIDWVTTYGKDPAYLRKLSADAGLAMAAYTFFIPKDQDLQGQLDHAAKELDAACTLEVPLVMIPPCPLKDGSREEHFKQWMEILAGIAPMARSRNLMMTIENFPGLTSPFVTSADFYAAKKEIPELKLTFDNGNAFFGEDPVESVQKCFPDIVHVHLKDWQESPDGRPMLNGRKYVSALIGEGVVDSRATVKALQEAGYQGYINIEYEDDKYPADQAIRKVLADLRQV